jgi:hypothetical protein
MLGKILAGLTDADSAETVVASVAGSDILIRIQEAAVAETMSAGALIASKVRHLLERGSEDVWLDLFGAMAASPQPAAAAIERVLALAFPNPGLKRSSR